MDEGSFNTVSKEILRLCRLTFTFVPSMHSGQFHPLLLELVVQDEYILSVHHVQVQASLKHY